MSIEVLSAALASARDSHAAYVTLARNSTGAAAEQAWHDAGTAHLIASNLCVLLATAALERGTDETA